MDYHGISESLDDALELGNKVSPLNFDYVCLCSFPLTADVFYGQPPISNLLLCQGQLKQFNGYIIFSVVKFNDHSFLILLKQMHKKR